MADDISTDQDVNDFSRSLESVQTRTRDLQTTANGFARAMTGAFTRSVVDGRRFDDVLKSLALRLSDLSVRLAFKPIENSLSSGFENIFGNLFSASNTQAQPFATGGVIASPTYFPLGQGGVGLAGEAGPEAIIPLSRGSDGRLGVAMSGGSAGHVTVNISTPDAESFRRSESYMTGLIARAVSRGQRSL